MRLYLTHTPKGPLQKRIKTMLDVTIVVVSIMSETVIEEDIKSVRRTMKEKLSFQLGSLSPDQFQENECTIASLSGTVDEIALFLASKIAKLHNSSQLRSYTNYYNH